MNLSEYQEQARKTALYPEHAKVIYPALKLAGEAGEVAEKIGKMIRDQGLQPGDTLTDAQRDDLTKELGDVLWYIANLAADIGVDLGDVGALNLEKLFSRLERGVIGGSGDNR